MRNIGFPFTSIPWEGSGSYWCELGGTCSTDPGLAWVFFPLFPTFTQWRKKTPNPNPLAEVVFSHQNECKCCKNTSQELLPAKFHTPACHIRLFHVQTAAAASLPSFLLIFFPQDSGEESGRNVLPKLSLSRSLSTEQAGNHFPKIKKKPREAAFQAKAECWALTCARSGGTGIQEQVGFPAGAGS